MSVTADGGPVDESKAWGDKGDMDAVTTLIKAEDATKDVVFNPATPNTKRPWVKDMASDEYNKSFSDKKGQVNATGFLVLDPVYKKAFSTAQEQSAATASDGVGWTDRKTAWGFRFHYNPTTFEETYARTTNIDYISLIRTISASSVPLTTANTGSGLAVEILLDRWHDMRILTQKNWEEYYPAGGMTKEDRDKILEQGTMWDLEFLFRLANGDPKETWRGSSSNWGMLLPVGMLGFFGDSKGSRKMRVVMQNISWQHQQFAPGMIPVYTTLSLNFTRLPDNYGTEGAPDGTILNGASLLKVGGGSGSVAADGTTTTPTTPTVGSNPGAGGAIFAEGAGTGQTNNGKEYNYPPGGQHAWGVVAEAGFASGNWGVNDISVPQGTQIFAHSGGVVSTGTGSYNPGYVKVTNGESQVLYGHLQSFNVTDGQTVKQGDPIGVVADLGDDDHVHLEWSNCPTLVYHGNHDRYPWLP